MDEEAQVDQVLEVQDERSAASRRATEDYLNIVLGEKPADLPDANRGSDLPKNIPSARDALAAAVEDTLALISERASKTGQSALNGLSGWAHPSCFRRPVW